MYTVAGTIYGEGDFAGLPGATVSIVGTSNGVSTNARGQFVLAVPSTLSMIKISSLGYADRIMAAGAFRDFETLDVSPNNLDEVIIEPNNKKDNTLLYAGIGVGVLAIGYMIAKNNNNKPQKVQLR